MTALLKPHAKVVLLVSNIDAGSQRNYAKINASASLVITEMPSENVLPGKNVVRKLTTITLPKGR